MNEFKEDIKNLYKKILAYKHICISMTSIMLLLGVLVLFAFPAYEQQQLLSQTEQKLSKRLEVLEKLSTGQVERENKNSENRKLYEQLRRKLPSKLEGYTYLVQLNNFAEKTGGILKENGIVKESGKSYIFKVDKNKLQGEVLTIGLCYHGNYEQMLDFLELLEENYLGTLEEIRIINGKNGNLALDGKLKVYALQ